MLGSNLPHQWLCDENYFGPNNEVYSESVVIQFKGDFLNGFFGALENKRLRKVLDMSNQGMAIHGMANKLISEKMIAMLNMDAEQRLYTLMEIFFLLCTHDTYTVVSSPGFAISYQDGTNHGLKKVIDYIMEHFQKKIQLKELLDVANMSSTAFSVYFKKNYNMSFSEYLLKVRIGYACNLLTDNNLSIYQVASDAGFENLSNFNRLFKKSKGLTPKEFRKLALEREKFVLQYM
jgi:YesN/AraC family two-component response regulator